MTTDTSNTPTPEFRAQLEWEVTRGFRREARLGERRRDNRWRRLRAVGLVALCIAVGTGTGIVGASARQRPT